MSESRTPDLGGSEPFITVDDQAAQSAAVVQEILPLHSEEIAISRRRVETGTVQVATVTRSRDAPVDEALTHERVEIERVPIGRVVDAVPPVREEGDTTIVPVIEEVVVVERRLVLKEEVHIRRVRVTAHHRETVVLREQEAVITRKRDGDSSED